MMRKSALAKSKYIKWHYLKFDIIAAIVVTLVAIPLCLGVALASGAPLFSGILSGIIGGIIVGVLSGSQASISGPAAGMAAVVFAAVSQLGFNSFLLALVLAGIIQIIVGALRAGVVADYIPSNVVQGLLCAIGILLIVKQLPLAFSHSATFNELKILLLDTSDGISWLPFVNLSEHFNIGTLLISIVSLVILFYFETTKSSYLKSIPAPMLVVICGIILNELFAYANLSITQNTPQLVNIPTIAGVSDFINQLQYPNWSAFNNPKIYLYALIIAVVASLESLLNLKAIKKIDKKHRNYPNNRELIAQGVGNLTAGLTGGIPITSVIVRSSVNIDAGSKSKASTIMHGLLIGLVVIVIPNALNKIPLSSLAALLIFTGYKLCKPTIFAQVYRQGWDRFIPFIITVISIVTFNLLAGILIGLVTSLFYILKYNSDARLDIIKEIYPNGITHRLLLPQQVSFLNKASLIAGLNAIPTNSQLIIDARNTLYIDKEIIELMHEFKIEQAPIRSIALNFEGFKDHYTIHNFIDFINVTTYDVQSTLRPERILHILQEGNQRFLKDMRIHRASKLHMQQTAEGQHPIAVVLGCIDSRVPVETIFDMTFGDIFCIRLAGNVVNEDVIASMEYACHIAKAKLIVVLGHTRCGAIQAACDGVEEGNITQLLAKIKPAVEAETEIKIDRNGHNSHFVNHVIDINIANALQNIYNHSPILSQLLVKDEIGLVGAVYDVTSGIVKFKDYSKTLKKVYENTDPVLIKSLTDILQKAGMAN